MPLGYEGVIITTSAGGDITGSRRYTRFLGPILIGAKYAFGLGAGSGIANNPPHVVNVSTQRGDCLISVVSTFASTAGSVVSTATPTGLMYIPLSTGHLIAAGSTANAPTGLPGGAHGAALVWDSTMLTLAVYDPASTAWLWPHWAGSSGATITWSASSS